MKILVYVLHGAFGNQSVDNTIVIGVSVNIEPLQKRLREIVKSEAGEYVEMHGYAQEKRGERYYEASNILGNYARFYIAEHDLDIPEPLMGAISLEMERIDRIRKVEEYLQNLYDSGSIAPWVHEYIDGNEDVMNEILQMFDKMEDCNTPFNTTMEIAVGNEMKTILLDDEKLEYLWDKFENFPGVDKNDCLLDDFLGFKRGTHREEVWHWFDERYSGGVVKLMNWWER